MRIWNGLRVNDIVVYKGNKYIISELYEEDNTRLCNLTSYDKEKERLLKGVLVYECIRVPEQKW